MGYHLMAEQSCTMSDISISLNISIFLDISSLLNDKTHKVLQALCSTELTLCTSRGWDFFLHRSVPLYPIPLPKFPHFRKPPFHICNIQERPCGTCLSGLLHLTEYSLVPPVLSQLTRFHSFLQLNDNPLCVPHFIHTWFTHSVCFHVLIL